VRKNKRLQSEDLKQQLRTLHTIVLIMVCVAKERPNKLQTRVTEEVEKVTTRGLLNRSSTLPVT